MVSKKESEKSKEFFIFEIETTCKTLEELGCVFDTALEKAKDGKLLISDYCIVRELFIEKITELSKLNKK